MQAISLPNTSAAQKEAFKLKRGFESSFLVFCGGFMKGFRKALQGSMLFLGGLGNSPGVHRAAVLIYVYIGFRIGW